MQVETYSRVGSELVKEFCSNSKSGGSGDNSLMGERKVLLIVFASSDILGVPRRCCRCLPQSDLTSFHHRNGLHSFRWLGFAL